MFRKIVAAGLGACLLLTASPSEAKTCKTEYVTGIGDWRIVEEFARQSAVHSWRVWAKIRFGYRWNTWSRAEDHHEVIEIRYIGAKQYRYTLRARPCKL